MKQQNNYDTIEKDSGSLLEKKQIVHYYCLLQLAENQF